MSTSAPTITPIKADFEVTITRQGSNAVPDPIPTMAVGKTVRYISAAGEVRILFPVRSPFRTDHAPMTSVPGGVVLTLVSDSGNDILECRCFITLQDLTEIGWSPDNLISGGRHKVTPPQAG